ncbi:hypothetical protein WG907_04230 [Sphingobium sp. AN558]|uniref:hypothetical protein n=1 Tax=Sphingobium sp. AN558 TaxID=3133442 RepID=UPI0030BF3487
MTMPIERLIAAAPAWTDETWAQRLDAAASLLFLHGYIPQSTRAAITRRIEGQFQRAIENGDIVERLTPNPKGAGRG